MTSLAGALLLTLAVQSSAADSLRAVAVSLPESALASETRARPLVTRQAITEALARMVTGPAAASPEELKAARLLAAAYASAWRDSFLTREVARFAAWTPRQRAAKLWADSVRRAGNAAYGKRGPPAAIAIWRRALARATPVPDSTGVAALLSNIGSALVALGRRDSAEVYLDRARLLASAIGDLRAEATAIGALGGLHDDRGDLEGARQRYSRALELHERIGDTRGIAADENNLGLLAQKLGDPDEAQRRFEAALSLNRSEGREEIAATNLVNLAGLASIAGDFVGAEASYRAALATWRRLELWTEAAAALDGLGQLELRRGDYVAARAPLLEALTLYQRAGLVSEALIVRRAIAGAFTGAGDLQGALDQLRAAQREADSADVPAGARAGVALAQGDLAMVLNTNAEAERLYTRAEALYREANDAGGAAEAQQGLATLLLARDDQASAQRLLETALRAQQAAGNRRSAALTRLALGRLSAARGNTAAARQEFARAAAELERVGDPVATAEAIGARAALEAGAALPAAAADLYQQALDRLGDRPATDVAWRLHAGLGLAWRARGATDAAVRELRTAIGEIEGSGRSLVLAERRSGFLADKWDVYAQLARTEHTRGRDSAAFEMSERLRAQEMLELLARGRIAAPPEAPAELVMREQDLRRRIAELSRDLGGAAPGSESLRGPDLSRAGGVTREALVRAEEDYADVLLEIRERAPRHAAVVSRETAGWRDIARRLGPAEAFVEYLVSDSGSLAFVVTPDTLAIVDLGVGRRELAGLVDFVRGTLEPRAAGRPDSLWRAPLRQLRRYLIAPVEAAGLLSSARRLLIVPQAELHYLPFAALLDDGVHGGYLVQRYELVMLPSGSAWVALADRQPRRASDGILALAPRPDALPGSRREVEAIARLDGGAVRVLMGSDATEEAFRHEAPTQRVLHLATYGVLNKPNPLFSFVELAPGGADDGRLEVHEIFGLSLSADLVVLSACETGLGSGTLADVPAGDDWVGLTRAFLHAGAANVVATLWPVQDWPTVALMTRFYEAFGTGGDPVRALTAAQRSALSDPATAHPFSWAGFVVVGRGGAGGAAGQPEHR
jgi:CHAT domain-containing protein/tetratricopeptide (TPR) repeat protein